MAFGHSELEGKKIYKYKCNSFICQFKTFTFTYRHIKAASTSGPRCEEKKSHVSIFESENDTILELLWNILSERQWCVQVSRDISQSNGCGDAVQVMDCQSTTIHLHQIDF